MIRAAGILFKAANDGSVLMLRRAQGAGDSPGLWDLPGGKVEGDETLADAAIREVREEIGLDVDVAGTILMRRVLDDVDYTTFLKTVPAPFLPTLNAEHDGFAWVQPGASLALQPADMVPPPLQEALADAAWKEEDHPRAEGGQFGTGSKVSIVTSHDPDTGDTTFHHVGDREDADKAHAEASDDEGVDYEPELHEAKVRGKNGERSDALHIVHSGDGVAGVNIHGAHLNAGAARGQAHVASEAEWEESGPRRFEAGLSDLEKVDVATQWNDDHAADHHDVQVKVDDDGDPILDDDGDFQFVQDGEDVEPGEDIRAAFDAVSEDLYPGDEPAAYPGLEEANDHFEAEGRHESVYRIHEHKADR